MAAALETLMIEQPERYSGLWNEAYVSNCAGCGRLLLSKRHRGHHGLAKVPEFVSGRIEERPYCGRCCDNRFIGN